MFVEPQGSNRLRVIPEIDIWRAATLMLKRCSLLPVASTRVLPMPLRRPNPKAAPAASTPVGKQDSRNETPSLSGRKCRKKVVEGLAQHCFVPAVGCADETDEVEVAVAEDQASTVRSRNCRSFRAKMK